MDCGCIWCIDRFNTTNIYCPVADNIVYIGMSLYQGATDKGKSQKVFLLFGLNSVIYFLALKKISFAIGRGMIEGITAFCHRRKNPTQKEAEISFNDKCR